MNQRQGEEWLQARYDAITGTDVAKILGCDNDVSRKRLMECKVKRIDTLAHAPDETKAFLLLGREFEPIARKDWEFHLAQCDLRSGFVPSMTAHRAYTWFTGTPDYIMDLPNGKKAVVEFKTHFWPSVSAAEPIRYDKFPLKHWIQVQAYLELTDLDTGFLFSWTMCHGASVFLIRRSRQFWTEFAFPAVLTFWYQYNRAKATDEGSCEWVRIMDELKFQPGVKASNAEVIQRYVKATLVQDTIPEHWEGKRIF